MNLFSHSHSHRHKKKMLFHPYTSSHPVVHTLSGKGEVGKFLQLLMGRSPQIDRIVLVFIATRQAQHKLKQYQMKIRRMGIKKNHFHFMLFRLVSKFSIPCHQSAWGSFFGATGHPPPFGTNTSKHQWRPIPHLQPCVPFHIDFAIFFVHFVVGDVSSFLSGSGLVGFELLRYVLCVCWFGRLLNVFRDMRCL